MLAGAAVVMAYTGLLLQSMRAVALWHSPWLPALFVLSSLSCGFALVVGAAQFSEAAGAFASVLSRSALADAGVIVAEALAAVALLATVAHAAQAGGANGTTVAAAESVRQLACGVQAPLFWGGFVTLGLAIPLVHRGARGPRCTACLRLRFWGWPRSVLGGRVRSALVRSECG